MTEPTGSVADTSPDRGLAAVARWVGLALQVGIGAFPVAATGLLAPPWAVAVVALGWAFGLVVAWRIGRTRPTATPLVPAATVVLWFAFMTFGDVVLGWVA